MSNIRLQGNPSGTGTLTIASPNTNSDFTLNLPTANGTIPLLATVTNNGVMFINGSGQPTTGSALTFDGTNLGLQSATNAYAGSRNGATFRANSGNGFEFILQSTNATAGTSLGFATAVTGNDVYFVNRLDGFYSWITGASGNSEQMRLTSTGLGIGTSSPTARLTVVTGSPANNEGEIRISDNATYYAGLRRVNATDEFRIGSYGASQNITFYTVSSERMRLDSSGNLGIGTSTMGSTGVSLPATYNLGWVQSAGESVPNIFRQTSSAATVVANGYRQSATANGFASSFSSSFAKSAIALNDGSVRFYTDTAAAVAAGTDVTPTERMRIDSAGNVGIGTSSPGYALQVTRSGAAAYVANTDGTGTLLSGVNGSGLGVYGTFSNTAVAFFSNSTEQMRLTSTGLGIGRSSPYTKLDVASGSTAQPTLGSPTAYAAVFQNGVGGGGYGLGISTQSSGNVWLQSQRYDGTATAYDMVLQPLGGNLGLGVTPSAWGSWTGKGVFQFGNTGAYLHGGGTGWSGGNYMYFGNNGYYNGTNWIYSRTNGATQYVQLDSQHQWLTAPSGTAGNAISFTQAMTLDANGDFLIGTTSAPANGANARNVVFNNPNSVATYVKISNAASGATASDGFDLVIGTTGDTYVYNRENGPMIFGTNNTERARIDSSGNLLVGTTSGSNRITAVNSGSLAAAIRCENSRNVSGDFALTTQLGSNCNNTSSYHIISATGGADRFYVFGNGNVQNQNNSYGAISDAKLKENVTDATPKLEKLNQVRVVNYNLIGETQKQIGVIAQELEQIFPGMVEETPDRDAEGNELGTTTKSVKYSVFVPMLIKAIQEQQAIIDAQQAALNQLKADVAALKGA